MKPLFNEAILYYNALTTLETRIVSIPASLIPLRTSRFLSIAARESWGSDLGSPKCESEALKSDALSGAGRHGRRLRALHQHKLSKMNASLSLFSFFSEAHAHLLLVDSRSPVFAELFNPVSFLRTFIRVLLRLTRDATLWWGKPNFPFQDPSSVFFSLT